MTVLEFAQTLGVFAFILATIYVIYAYHRDKAIKSDFVFFLTIVVAIGWFFAIVSGLGYVIRNIDWNSKLF